MAEMQRPQLVADFEKSLSEGVVCAPEIPFAFWALFCSIAAMLQCSGTLRAKDPVVELGQVTALWTSRWAVSRLETFHFSKRLHVTWDRSTAASLDIRMRGSLRSRYEKRGAC